MLNHRFTELATKIIAIIFFIFGAVSLIISVMLDDAFVKWKFYVVGTTCWGIMTLIVGDME